MPIGLPSILMRIDAVALYPIPVQARVVSPVLVLGFGPDLFLVLFLCVYHDDLCLFPCPYLYPDHRLYVVCYGRDGPDYDCVFFRDFFLFPFLYLCAYRGVCLLVFVNVNGSWKCDEEKFIVNRL